ncbi:hypothetical protein BOX15_Mlig029937g2 [Macrostomum lignano]|uniref:Uncharacterized protein n=1 Tax=Macrostomum lignano TaxID=282301 RepID=A0A267ELR2_9PLAT|nr:hypothetical protein BOX15_Mlig029937g2 [Macrostomum lignano]
MRVLFLPSTDKERPKLQRFDSPNLHHILTEVDVAVKAVVLPSAAVQRTPARSLCDLKHFRGHEYQVWLLVLGPLVLRLYVDDILYDAVVMLSSACYWLTLPGAPQMEVERAQHSLSVAQDLFKRHFGESFLTYNSHQVFHHLVAAVINFGPLGDLSAGIYETCHQRLRSMIHGCQKMDVEIRNRISRRLGMLQLKETLPAEMRLQIREAQRRPVRKTAAGIEFSGANPAKLVKAIIPTSMGRLQVQCFRRDRRIRPSNAFLQFKHPVNGGNAYGRVECISLQNDEIILTLKVLPTVALADCDPSQKYDAEHQGCTVGHIRDFHADVNPFDAEGEGEVVLIAATAITAHCAVTRRQLAILPCIQSASS